MTQAQKNNAETAEKMYVYYDKLVHNPATDKKLIPLLQREQDFWEDLFHQSMPLDILYNPSS